MIMLKFTDFERKEITMAIQVGNSYVSEAGYAHAKKNAQAGGQGTSVLGKLSKDFPDVNFTTNTSPYRGSGVNNIAISPNILKQMENDPDKRLEYESLIDGCNRLQKSLEGKRTLTGKKLAAHGFIIDANGGLSSWSISRADNTENKYSTKLPQNDKTHWLTKILEDNDYTKFKNRNGINRQI